DKIFGTARVIIDFKKSPWAYNHVFLADTSVSTSSGTTFVIQGYSLVTDKNGAFTYHASGVKNVSDKATGAITIYNAYSSAPQGLAATTRFQTPDGLIFRLLHNALVPGAEIKDGKIIPASVQANIVAEAPGPKYNVGPVPHLSIPGFSGSPKYNGFYGE